MQIRVEVPRKLRPLLQSRARYKGLYGGRGGAKSHFFAEQMIIRCATQPTRAVCIREIQLSIRDSVRQLLIDKISKFGLSGFTVLDSEIRGPNGSMIIFRGMQSYNADNIKSLEGYDIAWVEEAQNFSQASLDMLRPTLRSEGSELWFSWNPKNKTDPVDRFFRRNPPPDAISIMVNWRDNPWFPEVLYRDMMYDFATDEDKAAHVWNGAYGSPEGAILAKWVARAEREGRINADVAYDPQGSAIEVSGDIGFHDTAAWWYWQRCLGGVRVLLYDGDSGLDAADWCERISANIAKLGAKTGKVWLPHDARAKTFQSKRSSVEIFVANFGVSHVGVVPISKKSDQINAAREAIKLCEFNSVGCDAGLDGLRAWEYEYLHDLQTYSKNPLHNWASHPADAFAYGCQVMTAQKPPAPAEDLQIVATPIKISDLMDPTKSKKRA